MRFRLLLGACLAIVATCLLTGWLGAVALIGRHNVPGRMTTMGVTSGRFVFETQFNKTLNPFTQEEHWSVALDPSTRPVQGNPYMSPPVRQRASDRERLEFPLGWIAIIAAIPAVGCYLFIGIRTRARVLRGCCHRCGYDLRATPGKCPECGSDRAARSPRRWPDGLVPAARDLSAVVAGAGVLFFIFVAIVGGAIRWVGSADKLAKERYDLLGIDVTRFTIETSPRLSGNIVAVSSPSAPMQAPVPLTPAQLTAGALVLLPAGDFVLPPRQGLTDVAIVGVAPGGTTLRLMLSSANRVRLENLTIDCADNQFLDLRGGSVSLKHCEIINYNSGAGGSNAISGSDATLLLDGCSFNGAKGSAAGPKRFGNAMDLRGPNRVYLRDTQFIDNAEICRLDSMTFDRCTISGGSRSRPTSVEARFVHQSPTVLAATPYGRHESFDPVLDDPEFVQRAASGTGTADPFSARVLDRLECSSNPVFWLALLRDTRPHIRELARQQLIRLKHPAGPVDVPPALDQLPDLLARLDHPDSDATRAAILALSASPTDVANAMQQRASSLSAPAQSRIAQIQRLRDLSVPLSVEIEYARLAKELVDRP